MEEQTTNSLTDLLSSHFKSRIPYERVETNLKQKCITKKQYSSVCLRRSKSRNVSTDELFPMLQYLGRLYDHDPDNTKTMQKLHSILLGHNQSYDVDSMMKEVRACLVANSSSCFSLPSYYSPSPLALDIFFRLSFSSFFFSSG
jgi:hypothetical protein